METIEDMVRKKVESEVQLSFSKSDIEKRMLFPSGNFTSPGPLLALLLAVVLSVAFFLVLSLFPSMHIKVMLTQRGVVPY